MPCPTDHELSSFLDESLADDAREALSVHVDACPNCQTRLDRLTQDTDGAVARLRDLSGDLTSGLRTIPSIRDTNLMGAVRPPGAPAELPVVPGFDVLEEIGQGGMGVVYRARHQRLNRLVALKMVLAGASADPQTVRRFFFEAEVLARIRHPQVVEVYEADAYQGPNGATVPYLAMELLEGGTLRTLLKAGLRPPAEAAELVEGIARAVHAAHLQGIVHRDLKPANILFNSKFGMRNGELKTKPDSNSASAASSIRNPKSEILIPKVTDFGLAKLTRRDATAELTTAGLIVGTPSYMAPEQAAGNAVIGPAVDVYALGVLLFECLAGRPPFQGRDPVALLVRVKTEPPPDVRGLRPEVSRDLAAVVKKCLEKDPARRYSSAEALANDLHRYRENRPTKARPAGPAERVWRWAARNPAVAGLLACLAVVLVVGVASVFVLWQRAERTADDERRAKDRAEVAEKRAVAALREGDARQARLEFDRAVTLCEDGQVERGLHRFRRALELAEGSGSTDLSRVIRVHQAAWPGHLFPHVRTFSLGHETRAIAFSPDGKYLATAGENGRVALWEVDTGHEVRVWNEGKGAFRCVALSADGQLIAAGAEDGRIRVWETHAGNPGVTLPTKGSAAALAFAPDGTVWATDGSAVVRRCDLGTRTMAAELTARLARAPVQAIALSADGTRLFTGDRAGFVFEWDTGTGKNLRGWTAPVPVNDLALSADGSTLALAGPGGGGRVINLRTGRTDHDLNLFGAAGVAVAFSPAGNLVLIGDSDGNVRTIHRATGQPVGVALRAMGEMSRIAIRPGSDEFAVCAGGQVHLCRFITPTWRPLATDTDPVRSLDFDRAGRRVAVAAGRRLGVFDAKTAEREANYPLDDDSAVVRFDPTRPRLLWGGTEGWGVVNFSDGRPRPAEGSAADGPHTWLSPLGNGRHVLTASRSGLGRWDAETRQRSQVKTFPALHFLDVRSDGTEVLAASGRRIEFLNPDTLASNRPGLECEDEVTVACYSADGTWILVGLRNNDAVRLGLKEDLRHLPTMTHGRAVTAVAVSPDGATLLTGSRDGAARFWDAKTHLPLGPVLRHAGPVTAVAFSPAGDRVATGTSNGHALVWATPPSK